MASSINLSPTAATSGSGIDVTSVVNQILDAERGPEKIWQQQQATLTTQTAALNALNSSLSALAGKVNALSDALGAITAKSATSTDPSLVSATAQTNATAGSHTIVVQRLATTSSLYSDPLSGDIAPGDLWLQAGGSPAIDITVDSSNNTLDGLAASINGRNLGITASVVNDADGARLALVSQVTGEAGDLTIVSNNTGLALHKSSFGLNAAFTLDGVPLSSATNIVTSVLPGVGLQLNQAAPDTSVSLTIGPDVKQATDAINSFVSAYNAVIAGINQQFSVTSGTSQQGPLAGDISLRSLQSNLLADVTYSVNGNQGFVNLASIGVDMADDGTLTVDSTKLNDALTNHYAAFQGLLQAADGSGFAQRFQNDLQGLTDPTQGVLYLDLAGIASTQQTLTDEISDFEARLANRQKQLTDLYSRVDAALREYPLLLAQINGMLGSLPSTATK
jgi:flagellar hook-associated protein 2